MRTLVVTNDLPPRSGGIETFIHELLIRQPDPAAFVVLGPSHPDAASYDTTVPFTVVRHRAAVLPSRSMVRVVVAVAERFGCDQVVIPSAMPVGLMVPALRRAGLRVRVVMTHGNEAGWLRVPGMRTLFGRIGRADAVTYLGDYTRSRIQPALRGGAIVRRLAPAVNVERFHPDVDGTAMRERWGVADAPVVACISRLVPRKGQDRLIDVWPEVCERIPGARLLIVGDGPYRKRLERLASARGVADAVVFTGRVEHADLPAYYAACDVFALPCRTRRAGIDVEGLGIVLLEASATGRPVIAGDSGGAPDAVDNGITGVVIPDRRDALIAAICDLLGDPARRARMGAAGRAWVIENWTWSVPAGRFAALVRGDDPDAAH